LVFGNTWINLYGYAVGIPCCYFFDLMSFHTRVGTIYWPDSK
jgi:hypothetical protein